jgi:hypothetical protein
MFSVKKLDDGGSDAVAKMLEDAALLGVDVIELLWKESTIRPRHTSAQVVGIKFPRISGGSINVEGMIENADSMWVDGTLKFYPDANGRCWGYIYDIPANREHLYYSFNNDWFSIVDKRIREEIKQEAEERGIDSTPAEKVEISIKKTKRELEAEAHAKALQKKLDDLEQKEKELKKELALAKGEKTDYAEKRVLKGVKIPDREKFLGDKNADESSDNAS